MNQISKGSFLARWSLLALPSIWLYLFCFIPLLLILQVSLSEAIVASPPFASFYGWAQDGALTIKLHFENFAIIFSEGSYVNIFIYSLLTAGCATIGTLIVGYPMAYGLTKIKQFQGFFLMVIVLPFWISFLLRVYGWLSLLKPGGLVNTLLIYVGLEPMDFLNSQGAVIFGLIYFYLPFMIVPIYISLQKINPELIESAADLGARRWSIAWHVLWPLSLPGVIAGTLLVFVPCVGEYVVPEFFGGPESLMIGRSLWNEFFFNKDWPVASALALITLVVLSVPMMILTYLQKRVRIL
jgi:putrescine transport system permease protein